VILFVCSRCQGIGGGDTVSVDEPKSLDGVENLGFKVPQNFP
jgi:hypothetical protein